MDATTRAQYQARARIIKALAHPTRLFLVDELSRGERCVGDLHGLAGDDLSTISKHLSVLRESGIVSDERRGNQVYYSLRTPCVMSFFGCVETVLRTTAQQAIELVDRR